MNRQEEKDHGKREETDFSMLPTPVSIMTLIIASSEKTDQGGIHSKVFFNYPLLSQNQMWS